MSTWSVLRTAGRRFILVGLVILGSGIFYLLGNIVFRIQDIEVVGTDLQVVVDESKIPRNLLFFPSDTLRQQLLSENPLIERIEIKKKFPHTLVIVAAPRRPIARLNIGGGRFVLDKSGVVIGDASAHQSLPLLLLDTREVPIGAQIQDKGIRRALSFIDATRMFLRVDTVEALDSKSLRVKTDRMDIIIPQQGEVATLATTLQTLISGFRIKGTLPTVIDLRFDKPIVTF